MNTKSLFEKVCTSAVVLIATAKIVGIAISTKKTVKAIGEVCDAITKDEAKDGERIIIDAEVTEK